MNTIRAALLVLLALTLAATPGCVRKSFGVRSDPPGAQVFIDGLEVGTTPVDYIPFEFYGTRELALVKSGYRCERRVVHFNTPWYSSFPIDIFSELLCPFTFPDRREFYFELRPAEPVEKADLLRHALDTRDIGYARIDSARRETEYQPRAYTVEGEAKPFVIWGPFYLPPRAEPQPITKPSKEK